MGSRDIKKSLWGDRPGGFGAVEKKQNEFGDAVKDLFKTYQGEELPISKVCPNCKKPNPVANTNCYECNHRFE